MSEFEAAVVSIIRWTSACVMWGAAGYMLGQIHKSRWMRKQIRRESAEALEDLERDVEDFMRSQGMKRVEDKEVVQ